MARLLGIDFGTTSFKAIVYDQHGEVLATARTAPPDQTIVVAGSRVAIWQPEAIWQATCALTRQVLAQLPDPRIDALAIAELGLVGIPVDGAGKPLFPAVTWINPAAGIATVLGQCGLDDATVFSIAGNWLNPLYPPAWIAWLRARAPEFAAGMAHWLNVGDYIALRLSSVLAVDYSMASQTLTFDQRRLRYDPGLLDAFDLPRDLFAPALQAGTPLGTVHAEAAIETGLPTGTPVILGGADYICGAYGAGFVDPGDVAILTGTWELVLMCADRPPLDAALGRVGAICDPHVAPDRWSIRIETFAGEVTEWYRREMSSADTQSVLDADSVWPRLVAQAQAASQGSNGLVFLPHLYGSYGPRIDALARGAFVGLTGATTHGDLIRAMFEGLCYQTRHALETLSEGMHQTPMRIVCLGGGAKNEFWLQVRANVLGRDIEVTTSPDVTPRGVAMLAGVGAGLFPDHLSAIQSFVRPTRWVTHEPAMLGLYTRLYQGVYLPLCEQLAPANRTLAQLTGGLK
jgi:xylulokinase